MQKSLRSFALVAVLALTVAPAALANQTGCDPHPQTVKSTTSSSIATYVYVALTLLGA